MAITQPLGDMADALPRTNAAPLPETGMLVLVGTGLFGLAAVVRRATRT